MRSLILMAAMILLPLTLSAAEKEESDGLKVMSYNIRVGTSRDGTNSWEFRYVATAEMFKDQAPDVMGLQEALESQVRFIEENFRNYKSVGVGRDDGKKKGEFMSILWNKKKVSLMKWGTFWLSETPDEPSKGWDAECFRTATWALMKDKKTGSKFFVVNTHLDHVGKEARRNGLKLIMDRIAEMNESGLPVVLMGDFNMLPADPAMKTVDEKMKSARNTAGKTDDTGTFNNWGKDSRILDYIYYSGFGECIEYQTVTEKYADRKFVSDHFPVFARLIF